MFRKFRPSKSLLMSVLLFLFYTETAFCQSTHKQMILVSGNEQIGGAGKTLAYPLVIKIVDDYLNPVSGFPVTFSVVEGGGNFDGLLTSETTTDQYGNAQIYLTLGSLVQTKNKVRAIATEDGTEIINSPIIFSTTSSYPFGKALYLNGDQQYFEIPDADFLNIDKTNDLTLEFYFKTNNPEQCNLINKWQRRYSWTGGYQGWFANLNREPSNELPFDHLALGTWRPGWFYIFNQFVKSSGSGGWYGKGVADFVKPGEWNHLALIFKKDEDHDNRGDITVYVNGIKRLESIYKDDISTPGIPLLIGGFTADINSEIDASLYLDGLIDEVRLWRVARSEEEVRATMLDTLSSKYYNDAANELMVYYRFEEMVNLGVGGDGLANDIRDLTGHHPHHGNVIGGATLLDQVTSVAVNPSNHNMPVDFVLFQNYPNPFNNVTKIRYQVKNPELLSVKIYNLLGQEVETLVDGFQTAGLHELTWKADALSSGLYICRMETSHCKKSVKMLLQK